jgi:hypothetical protein
MGHSHSRDLQLVDLSPEDFKLFLDEEYTVVRSDGMVQNGWKIRDGTHYCTNSDVETAHHRRASVTREANNGSAYKFFMVYDLCDKSCYDGCHNTPCGHVCGWRACHPGKRAFWPTRCQTQEDKAAWWAWVDERLLFLETQLGQKRQDNADENTA